MLRFDLFGGIYCVVILFFPLESLVMLVSVLSVTVTAKRFVMSVIFILLHFLFTMILRFHVLI